MEFNNINKFKGYLIPEQKLGLLVSYIVMAIIIKVVMLRPILATFPVSKRELPVSQPVWF